MRRPHVVARASEQLARYTHTCFLATPYEPYIEVAEALNRITPGDHEKRTALFNTGSEALENAVKYARAATGRPAVVVFDHAFHGRTLLTMTMTAKNQPYKHGFGPFAPEVYRAPMAYPYRWPSGPDQLRRGGVQPVRPTRSTPSSAPTPWPAWWSNPFRGKADSSSPPTASCGESPTSAATAASCWSPTRSRPGSPAPERGSPVSTKDMSRTSSPPPRAWPADLPLAAVTGRADIMDAAHPGGIGGTYSGNPVACAAALGVFDEIENDQLLARARPSAR